MYAGRARLAWAILIVAAGVCLLGVAIIPSQAAALVEGVARPEPAQLVVRRGAVGIARAGTVETVRDRDTAAAPRPVRIGSVVDTDANSEATLRFFDGSEVDLRPQTQVEVDSSRQRIFANGSDEIRLTQRSGRTSLNVSAAERRSFTVVTPAGSVALDPGSYLLPVQGEAAWLRVFDGGATAREAGSVVRLPADSRVLLNRGQPPQGPLAGQLDLVRNGAFTVGTNGLDGWEPGNRDVERNTPAGDVFVDTEDGVRVLRFRRHADTRYHGETYLLQRIDADVRGFNEIWVSVEFKLIEQSLAGGGSLHTEFPLELRLKWYDRSGQEQIWRQGYYARPREDGLEVRNGSKVGWDWTKDDLLLTNLPIPPPDSLVDVQLVASGWDYESVVRRVQVIVK